MFIITDASDHNEFSVIFLDFSRNSSLMVFWCCLASFNQACSLICSMLNRLFSSYSS